MENPLLWLRIIGGVGNDDVAVQATARSPLAFDGDLSRLYDGDKVVHDAVGNSFVENAFVSETLKVHFQAFQLDTDLVGNISEHDPAVVWLPRFGAN